MTIDLAKLLQPRDPLPTLAPLVTNRTLDLEQLWKLGAAIRRLTEKPMPSRFFAALSRTPAATGD